MAKAFSILAALALIQVALAADIANKYTVVLKSGVSASAHRDTVHATVAKINAQPHIEGTVNIKSEVHHEYSIGSFNGYSGQFSAAAVAAIKADPNVASVQPAVEMKALGSQPSPPSWGLIRTGERNLDLSQGYNYPDEAGSGITVYVVDTGIDVTHPEFEGRASWGNTACSGCASKDDHGHGTHCAGTIGGKTFGVAKKVKVVAVKVLGADGSGTDADVIAGINWAANAAKATGKPGVLSMSLGGGKSDTLDQAVKAAIAGGATFAVAAGNDSTSGSEADACEGSPSGVAEAIVVGATDKTDARAYFSDTGKCVSIFAPGVSILSAKPGGGSQSMDGTSMATPHVAGVAAIVLSQDSTLTPAQVKAAIVNGATAGKVKNPGNGSPNKLLFNAVIGAPSTSTTATSTSSSTTKTSSTTTKTTTKSTSTTTKKTTTATPTPTDTCPWWAWWC